MHPKPIKDQVLVRQDAKTDRLPNGLYIPDSADHALWNNFAVVLAVGPGRTLPGGRIEPLDVRVGDRVLFKRRPGSALVPDQRESLLDDGREEWADLLMIREEDIVGIVESD